MKRSGSGGKQSFSLYSCAGEGVILQHDAARLSGEASDIDQLIKDTNSIKVGRRRKTGKAEALCVSEHINMKFVRMVFTAVWKRFSLKAETFCGLT